MPGADSSSKNSCHPNCCLDLWEQGDSGRLCRDFEAFVFKDDGGRTERLTQRRLTAYSPSISNSSVYRLNSCVHSSRVGVFD